MSSLRLITKPALACFLIATTAFSHAQSIVTDSAAGTIYRLNDAASYQEGCLDPCLCPIGQELAVRGTFKLGPAFPGDVVDFRAISDVSWTVNFEGTRVHTITGSGVYRITNFDPDPQHALDLDLSIDGEDPQHFFSDFVPVSSSDGTIDIPVSINGFYCYDIVIRVSASPVPADELTLYTVVRGSSYQIACFDPCDCVSQEPSPMRGRFFLVPLLDFGTYAEFSIVDARFGARDRSNVDTVLTLRGAGHYTLIQGFAGPAHTMDLDLVLNGDAVMHFDQELENTDTVFPAIDIVVDTNDQVCTDTLLTLKARPLYVLNPAARIR